MPIQPDGSITGSEDADFISGTDGADSIFGLGGDDSLVGGDGDDSLVGGAGNDTLRGGYGDDTLLGGDGDDEIEGLYGNDVIDTGAGNDHVFGRDGDDLVYGREGDDHLIGSMGTDTIFGGDGNDTLAGSQGNDEIHGGDGNDLAFIGVYEGSDSIYMDSGNDFVDGASAGSSFYAEGGDGNDTLNSGVGNDTLLGGAGNDVLNGGNGDDTLIGGGDDDIVTGGNGDDVFILQNIAGSVTITDFGANGAADLVDLSQLSGYDTAEAVSAVMTVQQGATVLNLNVDGGSLVVTILSQEPIVAENLGLTGVLTGTILDDTVDGGTGDDTLDGGTGDGGTVDGGTGGVGTGSGGITGAGYAIDGPDAGHFVVNSDTGEISNMDWFSPSYDEVWDVNGDHIYEVSVFETDGNGAEISRNDLELVVTQSGSFWRGADDEGTGDEDSTDDTTDGDDVTDEGDGEDTVDGGGGDGTIGDGPRFALAGEDAGIFDIDPDTGEVSYKQWFTPSYDEVWDMDRDHIYEVSVVETNGTGEEVSRADLELVVSETEATWREAVPATDEDSEGVGTGNPADDTPDDDTPDDDTTGADGEDAQSVDGRGGTSGLLYSLGGQDASIFEVEADTGVVTFQPWFTPSFDEVWDLDRDHIYEISIFGADDSGEEVVRTDLELVVSETEAVWREAPVEEDSEEVTGDELMALLFTPMADEDQIPVEDEGEEPEPFDF